MNIPNVKLPYKILWWKDIVSDATWVSYEEAIKCKPAICISTGWILKKTKDVCIIASDLNFDEAGEIQDVSNVTTIPIQNIIKIKDIKI